MTVPAESKENQANEQKSNDREFNFRQQEALFNRKLEEERQSRMVLEKKLQEYQSKANVSADDEESDEPYVDRKTLDKRFKNLESSLDEKIDKKAEEKARALVAQERQSSYLKQKSDFNNIMTPEIMQKLVTKDPELAEAILEMPEGFARQKLVYQTIKAMKLDQAEEKKQTIQEKVDANRRSPYYQPSGVGSAPYAGGGDFSPSGQKNAYAKLQELKNKLRLWDIKIPLARR